MSNYKPLVEHTLLRGRYEIIELIGQGGMGAVYLAKDKDFTDEYVAIKENLVANGKHFRREAEILKKLNNEHLPNVSAFFFDDFDDNEKRQYLVMDYVPGKNLWEKIEEQGRPLAEREALEIIIQICDAVTYLHSQGPPVIHRDIKPQNIKVTPEGNAVLVDFGLAKVGGAKDLTIETSGFVTPGFSPIEQYGGGTGVRSDIYALGATLYAILTSRIPPESIKITSDPDVFKSPHPAYPAISQRVSNAIVHAMKLTKNDRPKRVKDWKSDLQDCLFNNAGPSLISKTIDSFRELARMQPASENISMSKKDGKEMIRIPDGEFLYGEGKEERTLPEYWIDKTPVTNAEYARFVAETGSTPPTHWPGQSSPLDKLDHPVTNISLENAIEYAGWAGKRLPTGEEWEKAARGNDGNEYPWGNQDPTLALANFSANYGENDTTAVGRYSPDSDSPYGLTDCMGNVWEWCANRELRGGSWKHDADHLHITSRYPETLPASGEGNDSIGFRCVASFESDSG